MRILEQFDESKTDEVLDRYENDGRFNDVGTDHDGDIILFEN